MNLLRKNLKRATALTVAISLTGGVAFALKSKHDKIKSSDVVTNNVGKIANPQEPVGADDYWTGNYIYFGHYPQSSDGSGGYNNDPIKWRVFDNNNVAWDSDKDANGNGFPVDSSVGGRQNAPIGGNGILIVSNEILNAQKRLNYTGYDSNDVSDNLCWSSNGSKDGAGGTGNGCTLWAWLNDYNNNEVYLNDFLPTNSFINQAFNNYEINSIMNSKVYTEDLNSSRRLNSKRSISDDKIFTPSFNEMRYSKYGVGKSVGSAPYSNQGIFAITDYFSTNFSDLATKLNEKYYGICISLRTPWSANTAFSSILGTGYTNASGSHATSLLAILPAMNLDISKVLFVSKADDSNKLPEISSVPTAFGMPTGYGNEYKLTIKNNDIGFEIDRNSFVQNGSDFTFRYSNATVGSKNYISCIIDKKEDASYVKYYGKLAKAKSSDTITIRIPADITDGAYQMKFFDEECNGAQETDYASEPVVLRVNNEGKVEGTYEATYADVESIEIQPQSHSASGDGPADQTTVILRGKNFSSNYKATIEFRIDGGENPVLSYPTNGRAFSDTNDTTLTINIPKSEMEKLNDHVGRYTVEAKVETN